VLGGNYTVDGVGIYSDCCSVVFVEGLRKTTEGPQIVGAPVGIGTWHLEECA
jgi:hypothetical protein